MYDVTMRATGDAWSGTFAASVRNAALDILSDGRPYGPVEVVYSREPAVTGTLCAADGDAIVIQGRPHASPGASSTNQQRDRRAGRHRDAVARRVIPPLVPAPTHPEAHTHVHI